MSTIQIANKRIGIAQRCYLIAEAGVNHNGDLERALSMVDAAAAAGADAVKFQTFSVDELILASVEKAPYQRVSGPTGQTQTEMLDSLCIDETFHRKVMARCHEAGVTFLSTPYGTSSLQFLLNLDVPAIKVASTDATNTLFLEQVAQSGRPMILSTGMCSLEDIVRSVRTVRNAGCTELVLLHCTSSYPTAPSEVNLRCLDTLRLFDDVIVGYSDHTEGVGASTYAVARGAHVVEKHFTLDKNLPGPDHQASLDPRELRAWVAEVRKVEEMLGDSLRQPSTSEQETALTLQKRLVTATDVAAGECLDSNKVTAKRTGGVGLPAGLGLDLLGCRTAVAIQKDTPILWKHLIEE
jgi:sialic acid synthase SpsE